MNRDTLGKNVLFLLVAAAAAMIPLDLLYASRFVPRFKELEKERIVTSNKLATAKIVSENLSHVRELVFSNMDFPGQKETRPQQTLLFEFLTTCVNDLKMRLVSVTPSRPKVEGRVTTHGYEIRLEGDFFSLGEFCAKLENSQRVLAVTSLEVVQLETDEGARGPKGKAAAPGHKAIAIRMNVDTFRVTKI